MSEMVERVARAIATADWRRGIDQYTQPPDKWVEAEDAYDLTNNNGRFHYDQIARAAIEAMREPTEHMVDIGACHEDPAEYYKSENEIAEDVWRAMIDAALTETQASSSEIAAQQQPEKQDG